MTTLKKEFKITGMHCASCEILIERKFKEVPGIHKVKINHAKGRVEVFYSKEPTLAELNGLVSKDGYEVSLWSGSKNDTLATSRKNTGVDYLQMGAIFLIIVAAYYFLKQFDFTPTIGITGRMSYGIIFLIGLLAAVSSCIAVVGGLLLALTGKYNESHPDVSGFGKFKPHIYFNVGRVLGYTGFGAAVGALGSTLTLSPQANGYLMVMVSFVMLLLGFQLLHLFPGLRRFSPKMPKFLSHKIHDISTSESKSAPFTLGALTFFLPCGFTQALQLYVLSTGDWKTGALTMLMFSLGTMPALVSLSALSSFARGAFQKHFLRFAGVLIVMLALFNVSNGLTLAGYNISLVSAFVSSSNNTGGTLAPIVGGKQIVKMTVQGYSYSPNQFTIVPGVPVEWQIDGRNAAGCGKVLVMPTLGASQYLSPDGITTINFTPREAGTIPFNCSMGMMTPGSHFAVVTSDTGTAETNGTTEVNVGGVISDTATACDPRYAECLPAQKLAMQVSRAKGVVPNSFTAKKGLPIELTIDDKDPLGGCMSVWVIPKFNITFPMNGTVVKKTFTPKETGIVYITCSMGSRLAQINVTD